MTTSPTGAAFNRGKSRQDFATPQDFRDAVVKRFGTPMYDLAADESNLFCATSSGYYSEANNSLAQSWHDLLGGLWLNPPFGNIAPWAKKCAEESDLGAKILFLIPASVGSNWYASYVHNKAYVMFLSPRLCFDGNNSFPKDLLLAVYNNIRSPGYECWRWKP